jgi:uncharacterized DUF497 family protein
MKIADEVMDCKGFEWDKGNTDKNIQRHGVSDSECEQVFFNQPFISGTDVRHSQDEPRYYALGKTDAGRWLFIVYTIRNQLIRVISARDMNKKEKQALERLQGE